MNVFSGSSPQEVAGLSQAISNFRNPYAVSPTMSSTSSQSPYPVRLVEFRPAWTIHALLRFKGITYLNENLPIPVSMSETLPVLVDGHHVISEQCLMSHIVGDLGSEENEMIAWLDERIGSLIDIIKQRRGIDMLEIGKACGSHFPTSWELMIKDVAKKVWSRYVREGGNRSDELTSDEIVLQLKDSLQSANSKLVQNHGYLLKGNIPSDPPNGEKRAPLARSSAAEAVLFGHLCEAINANIIDVADWDALSAFQTSVLEDYFQMAMVPPSLAKERRHNGRESFRLAMIEWRRSTDILLMNPFVSQLPQDSFIVSLLQRRSRNITPDEDREASWRRLMANTSTSTGSPERDDTSSKWVTRLRFSLQPLRRTLKQFESFLLRNGVHGFISPLGEGDEAEEKAALGNSETATIYPGGALFVSSIGACFVGYALLVGFGGSGPRIAWR
jgi:hypothetical protein